MSLATPRSIHCLICGSSRTLYRYAFHKFLQLQLFVLIHCSVRWKMSANMRGFDIDMIGWLMLEFLELGQRLGIENSISVFGFGVIGVAVWCFKKWWEFHFGYAALTICISRCCCTHISTLHSSQILCYSWKLIDYVDNIPCYSDTV